MSKKNPMESWLSLNKFLKDYDSEDYRPLEKMLMKEAQSCSPRLQLLIRLVGSINRLQGLERYRNVSAIVGRDIKDD